MSKRTPREPYNEFGFPASWNIESCGRPSFGAYRNAMEFCQQRLARKQAETAQEPTKVGEAA